MRLSELGETEIIDLIKENIGFCDSLANAVGEDDCAILKYSNKKIAYSSDILTREKHLPLEMSFKDIGWKIIAVNVSDLASMGAKPLFSTTSMALPDLERKELKNLTIGMKECAQKYNLCQAGGDVTEHNQIILNTSIIGEIENNILYRKNCQPSQYVAVTGEIGAAGFGAEIIKNKLKVPEKIKNKCLKKLFRPIPRIKEGENLSSKSESCAAIDISDGLSISLKELTRASGNGFKISTKKIPIDEEIKEEAKKYGYTKEELVDSGGDYELLFTTENKKLIEEINAKIIGKVLKNKKILFDETEKNIKGYRHFKSNREK